MHSIWYKRETLSAIVYNIITITTPPGLFTCVQIHTTNSAIHRICINQAPAGTTTGGVHGFTIHLWKRAEHFFPAMTLLKFIYQLLQKNVI